VLNTTANGWTAIHVLAGTSALADNDAHNALLRENLLREPKEIYEHAISVKSALEDLGRVCVAESLAAENFMTVRGRGSIQHLSSRVIGRLSQDRTAWDAFDAVFPAVTALRFISPYARR
jgi:anthranilate/para-aminobenzoate synthase component I